MPKISVVMSVYNGEKYIKESVESILSQTFRDFEFIIINDGSTDSSKDILHNYSQKDQRIKVIDQENMGLTKSLNKGIHLSKGEYIARQDVDDISLPERLAKEFEALSSSDETDLVCTWYYIIDESGEMLLERKLPDSRQMNKIIKRQNLLAHSSVLFRKSSFLRAGGYDERYRYGQDWFLWLKMDSIKVLPESLLKYRWCNDNITHIRHSSKLKVNNMSDFLEQRRARIISSLLLQQGELKKCRTLLEKKLYSTRNIVYYLLTFLPRPIVTFCVWGIKDPFMCFLRRRVPYYRKKITYV